MLLRFQATTSVNVSVVRMMNNRLIVLLLAFFKYTVKWNWGIGCDA